MSTDSNTVRVLHVTNARSLSNVLPDFSHPSADQLTVVTATTSSEGRQQVADHAVDCVVIDHKPPSVAGVELLESIRETRSQLPVIICVDDGSEELARDAIDAGVSAYLHTDEIAEQIDRVVDLAEDYWVDQERTLKLERAADLLAQTERIADVGGWEIDPKTREVFWTDHLFEMLDVDVDEELHLNRIIDIFHEADRAVVESAIEAALDEGEPFDIEVRFLRPNGEIGWLHIQGVSTVENGRVEMLRGAVKDVTERRNREQVLQEMHDIIADREADFDQQVRHLLELGRIEFRTQYGTLSEIDGDDYIFNIVVSKDDHIEEDSVVPVSTTKCEEVASAERTLVFGDASGETLDEIHLEGLTDWAISYYLGAPVLVDEEVYGTICFYGTEPRERQFSEWEQTLIDLMSRWVSYEIQRQRVTERLHEQNEQLERFASIVTHDLRNPLAVIDGYVQQSIDTGDVDYLSRVQAAVDRMDTIIDDVLLLSRSEDAISNSSIVNLPEIAANCWKTVPTNRESLTVTTEHKIHADKTRLKQLLENLFRNSVEHSSIDSRTEPDDGAEDVTVTVGNLNDGFYVEDNGPGIPESDRERIFKDGFSTSKDGTGLGLNIVTGIVEAHGWTIEVTESSTGGARFEITGIEIVD